MVNRYNNERFFLAINGHACRFDDFFCPMVVGHDQFGRVIKAATISNGMNGLGKNDTIVIYYIVTHGLRETVTSLLIEAGIPTPGSPDSSILKKKGHRCLESIRSYQNLRGKAGLKQQEATFGTITVGAGVNERTTTGDGSEMVLKPSVGNEKYVGTSMKLEVDVDSRVGVTGDTVDEGEIL